MSFKGFSIFSLGGDFLKRSGTILAILIEGHPGNISVKKEMPHIILEVGQVK